jgi:pimeloyl-ACP methyl ester carboxylesterase
MVYRETYGIPPLLVSTVGGKLVSGATGRHVPIAMIILHGALGSAAQMEPLRALLGARTIELPGHGATPLGAASFDIETFASFVADALNRAGGEEDIFGYSMGGYIAMLIASRRMAPIRRIVTLGTKFEWTPEVAARDASRLNPETIGRKVPAFAAQLRQRHVAVGWEMNVRHTAQLVRTLGDNPLLAAPEFERVSNPVCIMVGDDDRTVDVAECERIAALCARADVKVLPGTPHPIEQVSLEALVSAVTAFMGAAEPLPRN